MKIYYTTKEGFQETQITPNISLGGYPAINELPNDVVGNLFSSISKLTLQQLPRDTFAIALYNDSAAIYTDIEIYAEFTEEEYVSLEIAAVSPTLDDDDDPYIESITNSKALPMYASFNDVGGVDNKINIGDLAVGGYVFLWLKRQVLDKSSLFSNASVIARFDSDEELPKTDTIQLKISHS